MAKYAFGAMTGIVLTLSLSGCGMPKLKSAGPPQYIATSIADVGTVHVDVVGIERWSDVEASFKPNYGMNGTKALAAVGAISAYNLAATQNMISAGLRAEVDGGIVTNDRSSNSSSSSTSSPVSSQTSSSDTKNSTPSVPSAYAGVPGASLATIAPSLSGTPALAPGTALTAADGYFRYATTLDQSIGKIAKRCGMDAYLVMFKIALIPLHRNEPYDAYVDLSVLPGDQSLLRSAASFTTCKGELTRSSVVLTTFSADSLENTQEDWTAQAVRNAALSLAAKAGPAAFGADFQSISEALNQSIALRPNSLLTVGKISANSLRIRLGATRLGTDYFETLPMTHDIAVLLMVPKEVEGDIYSANARITYRDARSGAANEGPIKIYDQKSINEISNYRARVVATINSDLTTTERKAISPEFEKCGDSNTTARDVDIFHKAVDCGFIEQYNTFIRNGDYQGFIEHAALNDHLPQTAANTLWAYLLVYADNPGVSLATFEIPKYDEVSFPPTQAVLATMDDTATTLRIAGGRGFAGRTITVTITFANRSSPPWVATFVNADDQLDPIQLPVATGVLDPKSLKGASLSLSVGDDKPKVPQNIYTIVSAGPASAPKGKPGKPAKPAPKSKVTATLRATTMVLGAPAAPGTGHVSVAIKFSAPAVDAVQATAAPGTLLSLDGTTADDSGTITVASPGLYTASFENLVSGTKETLTLQPMKRKQKAGAAWQGSLAVH